jgi:glycosyltransferase involved in cell wall biosynthesis
MKQLSLVLVGDGPLLSEHKILATRLQIERQVLFVGEVAFKNVPSYFAQCTVYVLPSRSEPFGLVLLEAADYGKPIVCTRVGGVPEIITDGVDGVIVEPDDPASMAAEILTILRDGDLGRRLGNAARETLVARFLWKDRIRDYIEIFQGSAGPSLSVGLQERQSSASHDERVASADIR